MGIKEAFEGKKEWRALQKRARALPNEYLIVYQEIQDYFMKVDPINLTNNFQPLTELLDLFESGASQDKDVLDVTGPDVAAFADALLGDHETFDETIQKQVDQAVEQSMSDWLKK
ncbi:hypothetical protein BAU15_10160 [Enterococcus sp. JM4C]|uniref:DUF1048 domain-containing protein n=1 Tax=Candidatus Enterococcus huntleyi TaxID=1857217 RepID=UPI00137B2AE9|nr:DUF1048 domain-containing protein [Enterococcus sp. JM4C]KAF1296143.1 hypothetical protein BAU15_10160 [Enterococcus sp. JM4C]